MLVRLQKLIATAGVTSRRKAELLIQEGRVTVNGRVVTELGSKADPSTDHIKVNGKLIHHTGPRQYVMLNKPRGYITSASDPLGRPIVMQLVRGVKGRLYPVGRLDYHTEGLLLLTSDGELAHALMHPRFGVRKQYEVKVKGVATDQQIMRLSRGARLDDQPSQPCTVKKLGKGQANSWLSVTLHEGKYRQVRLMCEAVGLMVIKLKRVSYGPLTLGALKPGRYRHLTDGELAALRRAPVDKKIDKPRR